MNAIGILQGRLSPAPSGRPQAFPWANWKQEFADARACGFECLEWLVTADRLEDNPLFTVLDEIREQSSRTGLAVTSLCADCFIARPFVRVSAAEQRSSVELLQRVIEQSAQLGIAVVLIPLLENGAIRDRREGAQVLDALRSSLLLAEQRGIRIGLETDLPGTAMRELVEQAGATALGAYYDVGNAAALGHDVAADLRALGPFLFGMHIKDRRRGGPSVPLGEGDVNFSSLADAVATAGFAGPLILETPVGHDPVSTAEGHLAFVRSQW